MIGRAIVYAFAMLALLVVLFIIVVTGGMALYGIALVRSDAFGLFITGYILLGIPGASVIAIWLAKRANAPD